MTKNHDKHEHSCNCQHEHDTCKKHDHDHGKCSCGCDHSHKENATAQCNANGCCNHSDNQSDSCHEEDADSDDGGGDHHQHIINHNAEHSQNCSCEQKNSKQNCCGDGCGCGHEHSHEEKVTKSGIILLITSCFLFLGALLVPNDISKVILFAGSALLAGYDLFLNGLKMLIRFKFEENVLLLIAVVASFALLEFPEACIVTILFKLGSFLESSAINRSKKSMEKLTQIRPDFAYIKDANGNIISIDAKLVNVGDIIYIRAGDRIAVDCIVLDGNSSIDSSALTGESIPVFVKESDELMSGSVNLSGLLKCKATKSFENSTASQIIDLVYQSSKAKGKAESFISRFAKTYTPIVITLAIIIAIVPPLFGFGEWHDFIMRSLIFLVASCPCALVISIPLTFFASIGAISKHGVLVKGSMHIEKLAKINAVALDKTGTLTSGNLSVDEFVCINDSVSTEELLSLALSVESNSTHPIATSIVRYTSNSQMLETSDVTEHAGLGLTATYGGKQVLCGGQNMLDQYNISTKGLPPANVYVCIDNIPVGYITVKEEISKDSLTLRRELHETGIDRVIMLTGDNENSAKVVADKCNITEFYAGLLPKDKVSKVKMAQDDGNTVLFVGDGINDAPVLTCADLGISMGLGSEIANASSDIILSSNKLSSLPKAIKLSKRSMNVVYFNITFALVIKIGVLILGATGNGSMWLAVFADIGVTILTILNSIRILKFK